MTAYFNLGDYSLDVTTNSKEAQKWFNLGINWCYGFNHEEGIVCFEKALEYDEKLAMAYWGIAYAAGPFYNYPWRFFIKEEADKQTKLCFDSMSKAKALTPNITTVEADLISALSSRFQKDHSVSYEEFDKWDDDYADHMRDVYKKHPTNPDVMALCAEALITRTPWKLWDVNTGKPLDNSDVVEAVDIIEKAIAISPNHPAALHFHIHATEMSSTPEDALHSANVLGTLCPDAGHMNHMPGHTYVLCGLYEEAKIASEKAIRADNMYLDYAGPFNFYTTARCHDLHLMMYACMFLGQLEPSLKASHDIRDTLSLDVLSVKGRPKLAVTLEGYYSMLMHVLVRFGKWKRLSTLLCLLLQIYTVYQHQCIIMQKPLPSPHLVKLN
ncbi:MAG: hypothetical protein P8H03_05035 [Emcibacteraceae bacterium]|nr:hypothetical protein [Emcibacteraceae bacterium]